MTKDPRHDPPDTDGEGQDFQAKVAGQEIRIRRYRAMDLVLIISVLGVFGGAAIVYQDQRDMRRAEQILATSEHMMLRKEIREMNEAIVEQTFIQTLSQIEKQSLQLDMPESLRRKAWGGFNNRYPRDRGDSTKGGS